MPTCLRLHGAQQPMLKPAHWAGFGAAGGTGCPAQCAACCLQLAAHAWQYVSVVPLSSNALLALQVLSAKCDMSLGRGLLHDVCANINYCYGSHFVCAAVPCEIPNAVQMPTSQTTLGSCNMTAGTDQDRPYVSGTICNVTCPSDTAPAANAASQLTCSNGAWLAPVLCLRKFGRP